MELVDIDGGGGEVEPCFLPVGTDDFPGNAAADLTEMPTESTGRIVRILAKHLRQQAPALGPCRSGQIRQNSPRLSVKIDIDRLVRDRFDGQGTEQT